MSTTPSTKPCPTCNGTGYTCLNAYHTIPDDPDCIKCTTCHGAGVVAAEADTPSGRNHFDKDPALTAAIAEGDTTVRGRAYLATKAPIDAIAAALEAHYAARFERAIGEDGDNWPDSEVNGEEDFRQALAEESQNKLRAEARSIYYGEQAGGSDE